MRWTCWPSTCWAWPAAARLGPSALYREVRSAQPYARSDAAELRSCSSISLPPAATRYAPTNAMPDCGGSAPADSASPHPRLAQHYRMNVGTIIEAPMIKIRLAGRRGKRRPGIGPLAGGRPLGEVEEYFVEQLKFGDTFAFAGEVLRFEGLQNTDAFVSRTSDPDPMIPSYEGGKFPLSTHLAHRVRSLLAELRRWRQLPQAVRDWLCVRPEVSDPARRPAKS